MPLKATLTKIFAINAAEQRTFSTLLRNVTPAGLARGEENLFLGLSIDCDDPDGFDLPPDEDLFGHVVPLPKTDGGSVGAAIAIEEHSPTDDDGDDEALTWSLDDE